MIITALVSSVATGVIMLNNSAAGELDGVNIIDDKDLQEFITVYETIVEKYYDKVDKKAMLEAAEEGMLDFLGDKYTTFLGDEEYQEILDELSGTYNGIGISIDGNKIISVTSASRAGKRNRMGGTQSVYPKGRTRRKQHKILPHSRNGKETLRLSRTPLQQ